MEIRIYTPQLRLSGVSDACRHFRYTEEFRGAGTFQMMVPTAELSRFQREHVVCLPGAESGYIIERIHTDSGEGTAMIEGRGVLSYFARQILRQSYSCTGSVEDAILALGLQAEDFVPASLAIEEYALTESADVTLAPGSTLAAMQSLARAGDVGLSLRTDVFSRSHIFAVRSVRERGMVLSASSGTLRSVTREEDYRDYKNRVTVGGVDGVSLTVSATSLTSDGFDDSAEAVREAYLDARSVDRTQYQTETAYENALAAAGRQYLRTHRPVREVEIFTDARTAQILRPGDICPVSGVGVGLTRALCLSRTVQSDNGRMHYAVKLSLRGEG